MASVLRKNSQASSGYRRMLATPAIHYIQPEQLYGITSATGAGAAGQAMTGAKQALTFTTSSTVGRVAGNQFILATPSAVDFTTGSAAAQFTYEINGFDHFGDPVQEIGRKNVASTIAGIRSFRVFSSITSVYVTEYTTAGLTGTTISLGISHTLASSPSQRHSIPIPFKLSNAQYAASMYVHDLGGCTGVTGPTLGSHTNVVGGALDPTTSDSKTALGGTDYNLGWTPNMLAAVGIVGVAFVNPTVLTGAAEPMAVKILFKNDAVVEQQ